MERSAARHSAPGSLSKKLRETTADSRAGVFLRQNISLAVQRGNAASVMATVEEGQKLEFGGRWSVCFKQIMLTENDFHRTSPRIPNRFEKQVDNNDRAKIDERFKALEGKVKEF
ncbi:hypothetical protein ACOME3_006340 [Neoechinorhynchus agilis]